MSIKHPVHFPLINQIVEFDYVNYKGEQSHRRVVVSGIKWGDSAWHPEMQFLLIGTDLDKNSQREFAMKDITNFRQGDR